MGNDLLDAALEYHDMGFSVIPVIVNKKKPYVEWTQYQKEKASKDQILEWWNEWPSAGVGIVTGEISNFCVIDLDEYKEEFDMDTALKYFPDSLEVPTVKTPSGGTHLYFSLPEDNKSIGGNAGKIPAIDFRANGNFIIAPPSRNGSGKSYEWVAGLKIGEASFCALPKAYSNKISFIYRGVDKNVDTEKKTDVLFQKGTRDSDLFHVANCLVKGGYEQEFLPQVLEMLAKNCNPPFSKKEMLGKVKSALQRSEKKEINLAQEIKEWICLQVGTFCLQDVYNCLQLSTRNERKNVSIILKRLSEKDSPLIERQQGSRVGSYKIVDKTLKKIDLQDKSDVNYEMDIKFPLGIEDLIRVMPKTIYIIAGETDAGKSAFLMNFAKKNTESHKIRYFSSEMGKEELLDRCQHFWPDVENDRNFNFYERSHEFSDVIFPDDINIIDYVSLFDKFYMMAELIDNISMKLNKGIAFIALQKPKGRDEGLGGERTKDLSRLYLSLSPNNLKITKAKNWRNPGINPNNMEATFKLVSGGNFVSVSNWHKGEN